MSRAPAIFIFVTAILVIAFFSFDAYLTRTGKLPPENLFAPANPGPASLPRDALRLPEGVLPDSLMLPFARATDDAARRDAAMLWLNHWTPDSGWTVKIEEARSEFGHVALQCWMPNASIVGGGYMLIAKLPPDTRSMYMPSMEVTVFGRVSELQYELVGGLPQYRLILDDASVLR